MQCEAEKLKESDDGKNAAADDVQDSPEKTKTQFTDTQVSVEIQDYLRDKRCVVHTMRSIISVKISNDEVAFPSSPAPDPRFRSSASAVPSA